MRLRRRRNERRRGAAVVEMAFVAIILFVFMFAIFEYGRYMMVRQVVENAARAGARQAVVTATSYVTPAAATATVQSVITQNLAGQNLQNLVITIYQSDATGNNIGPWTQTPFGNNIVVQIEGDLTVLFPSLSMPPPINATLSILPNNGAAPNSVHIKTKCMMRGEAN